MPNNDDDARIERIWEEARSNAIHGRFENPYPDESADADVYRNALRHFAHQNNH